MPVTDQLALGRLDRRMTATGQGRQCRSGDPHNRRTQLADDFVPPRESADRPITEIGRLIRLLVGADLSRTLTRGDDDAVTDQCQSNTAVTLADDTRALKPIAQGRKCDTTKSHKHIPSGALGVIARPVQSRRKMTQEYHFLKYGIKEAIVTTGRILYAVSPTPASATNSCY